MVPKTLLGSYMACVNEESYHHMSRTCGMTTPGSAPSARTYPSALGSIPSISVRTVLTAGSGTVCSWSAVFTDCASCFQAPLKCVAHRGLNKTRQLVPQVGCHTLEGFSRLLISPDEAGATVAPDFERFPTPGNEPPQAQQEGICIEVLQQIKLKDDGSRMTGWV